MTPDRLLDHFDRISDAPDAIPRLRRFILDLAVRGKLVEQDPTDEPASALLKRIHAEKVQMIREGNATKEPKFPAIAKNEAPFDLPPGWTWARFPEVGIFGRGKSKHRPRNDASLFEGGTHLFVQTGDVARSNGVIETYTSKYNDIGLAQSAKWPKGTLCITIAANIADSGILSFDACFPDSVVGFIPASLFPSARYFEYFIRTAKADLLEFAPATAQKNINLGILNAVLIPLPPLAEQHRIVAKVDEIMALCDRLEAAQAERESRREKLGAVSLHRLNNGADADEFREHAHFHLCYLQRLTTRPEHIQQLRQTILNLAVRGKLVPQDPNDEPALELLKRIQAEKEELLRHGRSNLKTQFPAIEDSETPFQLPGSWSWVRLGELVTDADAGWSPKSEGFARSGENWGVLKVSAVSWDKFLPEENKQLLGGIRPPETAQVHAGDFLISRANTSELVGKSVVVEQEPSKLILSDKIVRLQIVKGCVKQFLSLVNNHAVHARIYYAQEASGTSLSMKNVSRGVIYALAVPLPPLSEQHRIVAKIDELMALCDRLEAQLTATQTEGRRLLEAVLQEALGAA